MVRLGKIHEGRIIVPGIIVKVFPVDSPPTFEVLAKGESWVVTHRELGPFDSHLFVTAQ
tara:strand:+ start:168 stop:344 length:177 start_codon:yes stop_codon:yes gene_type:complete